MMNGLVTATRSSTALIVTLLIMQSVVPSYSTICSNGLPTKLEPDSKFLPQLKQLHAATSRCEIFEQSNVLRKMRGFLPQGSELLTGPRDVASLALVTMSTIRCKKQLYRLRVQILTKLWNPWW
jgi:hypothetical protein